MVSLLPFADEKGILRVAAGIDEERNSVCVSDLADCADVRHGNGLPSPAVVGDRNHDKRDAPHSYLINQRRELIGVHVPLEREVCLWVVRLIDHEIYRFSSVGDDVRPRRIEVHVVGDDVAWFHNTRKEDVLRGSPLVRGEDVREAEDITRRLLEAGVAAAPGIGFIPKEHRCPLCLAHRACSRIGQEIDIDIIRVQVEYVVSGGTDSLHTLGERKDSDRLHHLNAIRLVCSPSFHPLPPYLKVEVNPCSERHRQVSRA